MTIDLPLGSREKVREALEMLKADRQALVVSPVTMLKVEEILASAIALPQGAPVGGGALTQWLYFEVNSRISFPIGLTPEKCEDLARLLLARLGK